MMPCPPRTIRRSARRSRHQTRNMSGSKVLPIITRTSLLNCTNASLRYWIGATAKDCLQTDHSSGFFLALHLLGLSSTRFAWTGSRWSLRRAERAHDGLSFHFIKCGREETDMVGESIHCVATIGTGTFGASWTAVFLARGLTVAASDPAPGAETFLREFVAAAWPSLARLSQ